MLTDREIGRVIRKYTLDATVGMMSLMRTLMIRRGKIWNRQDFE